MLYPTTRRYFGGLHCVQKRKGICTITTRMLFCIGPWCPGKLKGVFFFNFWLNILINHDIPKLLKSLFWYALHCLANISCPRLNCVRHKRSDLFLLHACPSVMGWCSNQVMQHIKGYAMVPFWMMHHYYHATNQRSFHKAGFVHCTLLLCFYVNICT